ncbi:MAG: hypothetical protein JSV09_08050 [Thermoplasmata archaeon]|nr:MAG: hypothetical protein JSV09_08050 [Thermoplasmata archaeon]
MVRITKSQKRRESIISSLKDEEKAFISIILMNNGKIPGPRLKRIYLERYTFWEMQNTEKKLSEKGLLLKNGGNEGKDALQYTVPGEFVSTLSKAFVSKPQWFSPKEYLQPVSIPPCGEYSILWYLMQLDTIIGYGLFSPKTEETIRGAFEKKVEESLVMDRGRVRFLITILKGLSTNTFFSENGYEKWSDLLNSPHEVIREIFNIMFDALREGGKLGRDDIGKDNMEFFFEELAALKTERWYSLSDFVKNAQSTLFSCQQPYRWIHFNEDEIWDIMNTKLSMLGIVEVAHNKDQTKFFRSTVLGSYLLNKTSEKKIIKMMSSRKGKIMVHPNFEVTLVSKEVNPKVLLELAMFSKPSQLDTMSVFKISKGSVNEGIRLGLTTKEMISFLRGNCKGIVPQNVEYSINDWEG